jgi:hypothetical protein
VKALPCAVLAAALICRPAQGVELLDELRRRDAATLAEALDPLAVTPVRHLLLRAGADMAPLVLREGSISVEAVAGDGALRLTVREGERLVEQLVISAALTVAVQIVRLDPAAGPGILILEAEGGRVRGVYLQPEAAGRWSRIALPGELAPPLDARLARDLDRDGVAEIVAPLGPPGTADRIIGLRAGRIVDLSRDLAKRPVHAHRLKLWYEATERALASSKGLFDPEKPEHQASAAGYVAAKTPLGEARDAWDAVLGPMRFAPHRELVEGIQRTIEGAAAARAR